MIHRRRSAAITVTVILGLVASATGAHGATQAAPPLPGAPGLSVSNTTIAEFARSVPAAADPATGAWTTWSGLRARAGQVTVTMPAAAGVALFADWNGDGLATPGRFDNGTWYATDAAIGTSSWRTLGSLGTAGDIPVTGQRNRDGKADIGVFRDGSWTWQVGGRNSAPEVFGQAGDIPVVGDWDGDSISDIGIVRQGTWILRIPNSPKKPSWVGKGIAFAQDTDGHYATLTFPYGAATDTPVAGDWLADGRWEPGIVRGGRDWVLMPSMRKPGKTATMTFPLAAGQTALVANQASGIDHCPTTTSAAEKAGFAAASLVKPPLALKGSTAIPGNAEILATVQGQLRYVMTNDLTKRLRARAWMAYFNPLTVAKTMEESIRRSANSALAGAIMLSSSKWTTVNGISRAKLLQYTRWNIRSISCDHVSNTPGGWGGGWQTALWAVTTGQAAWLIWPDLTPQERASVASMVISEAEAASARGPRYMRGRDGQEFSPGDSKSDEVSWDTMAPALALAMMPSHPNAAKWRAAAVSMAIAAFARPSDLRSTAVVNGVNLGASLPGTNANEDGTVTNHGIVNPDYTQNVQHLWWAASMLRAGRQPVPAALFLNADIVYRALAVVKFDSPPYAAPGGVVYQPLGQIYYPMGKSWGVRRPATFVGVDGFANVYSAKDTRAGEFLAAHAADAHALQKRYTDGHMYAPGSSEESYKLGKEEYALQQMALAWWAGAFIKGPKMQITNKPIPGVSVAQK